MQFHFDALAYKPCGFSYCRRNTLTDLIQSPLQHFEFGRCPDGKLVEKTRAHTASTTYEYP